MMPRPSRKFSAGTHCASFERSGDGDDGERTGTPTPAQRARGGARDRGNRHASLAAEHGNASPAHDTSRLFRVPPFPRSPVPVSYGLSAPLIARIASLTMVAASTAVRPEGS